MDFVVLIGVGLALAGLAGLGWCIRRALRLRRGGIPDDAVRGEVNRLVLAHGASIGAAFLGLALVVVGLLLQ